jgi:hypothetical protein
MTLTCPPQEHNQMLTLQEREDFFLTVIYSAGIGRRQDL